MAQDSSHFLNELPIWKLRIVAEQFKIDVTDCRYKRDYVEKIGSKRLSESQVRAALADARRNTERAAADSEMTTIGKELEEIASKPMEPTELPDEEGKMVERHVDEALTMKPSFFELDSSIEQTLNRMIIGDFGEAIKLNREARLRFLNDFSSFEVYSAAVSIRSAEELLAKIPDQKGWTDPNLRTALAAAKRAFINGTPRQREETLQNLETLASKAFATFIFNREEEEQELKELLRDYESFGTRTEESRRYLEIAAGAKSSYDFAQYSKLLEDAKVQAETAKKTRIKEIDNSFGLVCASAAEAKEVGVDTISAESDLAEARRAYDTGAFKRAVELLASVERATDEAHLRQVRKRKDLELRQLEKARTTVAEYEPIMTEAEAYGIDTLEGRNLLGMTSRAAYNKDAVNAAKLSRRLGEVGGQIDRTLDRKKVDAGVVRRVEGGQCDSCGKESIYDFPGKPQKCVECGRTQPSSDARSSATSQPAESQRSTTDGKTAEKKKWGLFRR